jgi:toxin-antitoxin system PIN domain toxin
MRLLDVNLLMALLWENHEHHIQARSWFRGVSAFATCPVVQFGFARVSAHPLLGYGLTPELAFGVLRQFVADPRHEFIPDDLSCTDRVVRTELMTGANQITDRYLVAGERAKISKLHFRTALRAQGLPEPPKKEWRRTKHKP